MSVQPLGDEWEIYTRSRSGHWTRGAAVRFTTDKKIHISARAYKLLGEPKYACMAWNRKERKVAIVPTNEPLSNANVVSWIGKSAHSVAVAAFVNYYDLEYLCEMKVVLPVDLVQGTLQSPPIPPRDGEL